MNIEESSRIRRGLLALNDHLHHLGLLLWQQLRSPAADASFVASGFKSRPRSLPQHGPLELCERSDHLHHHLAGRCRGVDSLCEAAEARLRFLNSLHERQHIPQGTG